MHCFEQATHLLLQVFCVAFRFLWHNLPQYFTLQSLLPSGNLLYLFRPSISYNVFTKLKIRFVMSIYYDFFAYVQVSVSRDASTCNNSSVGGSSEIVQFSFLRVFCPNKPKRRDIRIVLPNLRLVLTLKPNFLSMSQFHSASSPTSCCTFSSLHQ